MDVPGDYSIVPVQFENVDASEINLLNYVGDLAGKFEPVSCYEDWSAGFQITTYDSDGYHNFLWSSDAYDENEDDFFEGWADDSYLLTKSVPVTVGTAVWMYNPKSSETVNFNFAGAVAEGATKSIAACAPGYSLISSPFPVSTTFGMVALSGAEVERASCYEDWSLGIQFTTFDPEGYHNFLYANDAYDENEDDFFEGWADDSYLLVKDDAVLAAPACGMWFYNPNASDEITLTFTK